MNLDLGNIFSRAWKITWKNKILWLFGVLAALGNGGGNSGVRGSGNGNFNYQTGPSQYPQFSGNLDRFLQQLQQLQPTLIAILIGVACVVVLLSVVFLLLSLLGRGGLIGGARLADANGSVTFGEAWASGTQNLVRLFVIQLPAIVLGLLIFVIAMVFVAIVLVTVFNGNLSRSNPSEILGPMFGSLACMAILICPLAIVGLLLNILIHFARFAAVLEDLSAMAAFRRAWEVIKGNLVSILVLGIILIVINFLFSLIIGLPALLIIAPIIVGLGAGFALGQSVPIAATGVVLGLVCCAIYVPLVLVLRGVFETWATSAWTLAYQQFIHPTVAPASPVTPYPVIPADSSS